MNDKTCKHGIFPEESCSYCSGRRKTSDFSGIAQKDTFTHFNQSIGKRFPKKNNKDGVYEDFDQDIDVINDNLNWD